MNSFRPLVTLGMPWHGLAHDGILSTPAGNKTIATDLLPGYGQATLFRHPLAPGASRSVAQQTSDTANGYDWRNYALLTGSGNAINGGPALGADAWLYGDAGGATWVVRVAVTPGTGQVTYTLKLEAIFGRFGRARAFTPRTLASLVWVPEIPSWYGGAYDATDVAANLRGLTTIDVAQNADGSSAYVHIYCDNEAICDAVYPETQPVFDESTLAGDGPSLIGILAVSISGSGDLDADGAGITATLTEHKGFESGLVVSRSKLSNAATTSYSFTPVPAPMPPAATAPTDTLTWVLEWTLDTNGVTSGYNGRFESAHDVLLYQSPQGTVTRSYLGQTTADEWTIAYTNDYQSSYDMAASDTGGPVLFNFSPYPWWQVSCTNSGTGIYYTLTQRATERVQITYNVFGQVYSYDYESINEQITNFDINVTPITYPLILCPGLDTGGPARNESSSVATLNAVTLTAAADGVFHEFRPRAQNCFYLAFDYPQTDVSNSEMREVAIAVNEAGTSSEIYDAVTVHAPLAPPSYFPTTRELWWSYQPVTEQAAHDYQIVGTALTGIRYQYC